MKRYSFSHKMRQSLSDITNTQSQEELNDLHGIGSESREYINRLLKENAALFKLLEERNKTIELRRNEMRHLREGIHKLQMQNWSLAQSNTQFLGEVNLARNKVKALHHEVTGKNALLKGKYCEQEKVEKTQPRNVLTTDEESGESPVRNRRRFIRSKSVGRSTTVKIEADKDKSETKRRRRRSAKVRSAKQEMSENLFEIEDLLLTLPNEKGQQDNSKMASHNCKKEEEEKELRTKHQNGKFRRSPIYRPLRRAAEKIYSYKESFDGVTPTMIIALYNKLMKGQKHLLDITFVALSQDKKFKFWCLKNL